jgi:hypothetical protein
MTKTLSNLLIAALLAGSAAAYAGAPMQIAMQEGKAVAQFKIGDSRCVLKDDVIRCVPVTR